VSRRPSAVLYRRILFLSARSELKGSSNAIDRGRLTRAIIARNLLRRVCRRIRWSLCGFARSVRRVTRQWSCNLSDWPRSLRSNLASMSRDRWLASRGAIVRVAFYARLNRGDKIARECNENSDSIGRQADAQAGRQASFRRLLRFYRRRNLVQFMSKRREIGRSWRMIDPAWSGAARRGFSPPDGVSIETRRGYRSGAMEMNK